MSQIMLPTLSFGMDDGKESEIEIVKDIIKYFNMSLNSYLKHSEQGT